jgi:hypothetical protein
MSALVVTRRPTAAATGHLDWWLLAWVLLYLALARPAFGDDAGTWTQVSASPAYGTLTEGVVLVHASRMWVIKSDVWSSADGTSWTLATASPGFLVPPHAGAVFHDRMWVFGGGESGRRNCVWSSADGSHWTPETAAAQWSPRSGHAVTVQTGGSG